MRLIVFKQRNVLAGYTVVWYVLDMGHHKEVTRFYYGLIPYHILYPGNREFYIVK